MLRFSGIAVSRFFLRTVIFIIRPAEWLLRKIALLPIFLNTVWLLWHWLIHVAYFAFVAFTDVADYLFALTKYSGRFAITDREFLSFFFRSLWGDTMTGFERFWHLLTANFPLLMGLFLVAQAVRVGLQRVVAVLEKRANPSFRPISVTYFRAAELKHDAGGRPYMALGVLTESLFGHSFYIGFYPNDPQPAFVHVRDENPYTMNYLPPDVAKQLESVIREVAPLGPKAQEALSTYPM